MSARVDKTACYSVIKSIDIMAWLISREDIQEQYSTTDDLTPAGSRWQIKLVESGDRGPAIQTRERRELLDSFKATNRGSG